jgi:hypothetical protein
VFDTDNSSDGAAAALARANARAKHVQREQIRNAFTAWYCGVLQVRPWVRSV